MRNRGDFVASLVDAARAGRAIADLPRFLEMDASVSRAESDTLDRAMLAGARADRLGYAFASGYQAALASLFGARGPSSMLVTEAAGGHPRAIASTLTRAGDAYVLRGEKRFATLAQVAETLYVLAKDGERGDVPSLRVVALPRTRPGVALEDMPETPFCPEIPHATARFTDVHVGASELLSGDGYADYVKPFRTVEDLHVFGAALGLAVGLCVRARLEAAITERFLAHALMLRGLAALDLRAPGTALALDGALMLARDALSALPELLRDRDPSSAELFARDTGLFRVAASARAARTMKARTALGL